MVIKYSPAKTREQLAETVEPTPTPTMTREEQEASLRAQVKEQLIEKQIQQTYEKAPIVEQPDIYARVKGGRVPTVQVYAPTPEQAEKIVELAEQLPPEKRAKYIVGEPVKEAPIGIAETLAGISIQEPIAQFTSWITGTPVEGVRQIQEMQKKVMPPSLRPVEPVKEVGGWVASVEAPVYAVGGLVGLETPRPPPTISGGLFRAVLFGDPSELEQVKAYGPEYARGTILGDIAVSLAMGWVAGKAWTGLKKIPVVKKAPLGAERLKSSVMETIMKKAPERLQKWYYGPDYKTWKMEQELVWEKPPFAGYKEFYLTTETLLPTKPPAEQWLLQTRGMPITPFKRTLEAAIAKGRGMGGLAATQQIVVTEYAKRAPFELMYYPITEASARLAVGGLTKALFGFSVVAGLKAVTPQITEAPPKLRTVVAPSVKVLERQLLDAGQLLGVQQIQRTQQAQEIAQVQKQIQRQQLKQLQVQRQRFVQRQMQVPKWLMPSRPRKRKKRKRGKPLDFYGRYKRFYPVATAKEFLEMMF